MPDRSCPLTRPNLDIDALIAAGVYDPGAGRAGRLELMEWLLGHGVALDHIASGAAGVDLPGRSRRVDLAGRRRLTIAQVADAAGLPEATVRRARRLLGLTDPGDEPRVPPGGDRAAASPIGSRSRCSVRSPRCSSRVRSAPRPRRSPRPRSRRSRCRCAADARRAGAHRSSTPSGCAKRRSASPPRGRRRHRDAAAVRGGGRSADTVGPTSIPRPATRSSSRSASSTSSSRRA